MDPEPVLATENSRPRRRARREPANGLGDLLARALQAHLEKSEIFLDDPSELVRQQALKHFEDLSRFALDPSELVRSEAAALTVDPSLLQRFSMDTSARVRSAVASNPVTDKATLTILVNDRSNSVILNVLKHPSCPRSILVRGLTHKEPRFTLAALENPSLDVEQLSEGYVNSPNQELFTRSPLLPDYALLALVTQSDLSRSVTALSNVTRALDTSTVNSFLKAQPPLRAALAHTPLAFEHSLTLSRDSQARVRSALASSTPHEEILLSLASDPVPYVRLQEALNLSLPPAVQLRLAADEGASTRSSRFRRDELDGSSEPPASFLVRNPSTSPQALLEISERFPDLSLLALEHPNATLEVARLNAADLGLEQAPILLAIIKRSPLEDSLAFLEELPSS